MNHQKFPHRFLVIAHNRKIQLVKPAIFQSGSFRAGCFHFKIRHLPSQYPTKVPQKYVRPAYSAKSHRSLRHGLFRLYLSQLLLWFDRQRPPSRSDSCIIKNRSRRFFRDARAHAVWSRPSAWRPRPPDRSVSPRSAASGRRVLQ